MASTTSGQCKQPTVRSSDAQSIWPTPLQTPFMWRVSTEVRAEKTWPNQTFTSSGRVCLSHIGLVCSIGLVCTSLSAADPDPHLPESLFAKPSQTNKCKRSWSFHQKCMWQVTPKDTCTLCHFMTSNFELDFPHSVTSTDNPCLLRTHKACRIAHPGL